MEARVVWSHAHEQDVIAKVRESRPHDYLRVIAATPPKRLETESADRPLERLTDEELTRIIQGYNRGCCLCPEL